MPDPKSPTPWLTLLTPLNPRSKTGGRVIVIGMRPYRSKYTTLECLCGRRRRDGLCQIIDQIVPLLAHPDRVRVRHPKIDERTWKVPYERP